MPSRAVLAATQARSGRGRSGLERSGYLGAVTVLLTIAGTDQSAFIIRSSLTISQVLNDQPDTCQFTLKPGATAPAGLTTVTISYGDPGNVIFSGQVVRVTHRRRVMPGTTLQAPFIDVECIDWTLLFDRGLINTIYTSQSATAIAQDLVATWTSGFTGTNIASGLPTIDYFPLTNEKPSSALRRLVNLMGGGGFYIDPNKDVHLFPSTGETGLGAPSPPVTLANTLAGLHSFTHTYDWSQLRNRVVGEGRRTTCPVAVPAGAFPTTALYPTIPINDYRLFSASGGTVRFGIDRLSYVTIWRDAATVFGSNAYGATVTVAATAGAATINVSSINLVVDPSGGTFVTADFWVKIGDQVVYVSGAAAGQLTFIPATGYGSLARDVAIGEPVIGLASLYHLAPPTVDNVVDTDVVISVTTDDAASQATVAGVEGGDGIHTHPISDGRLSIAGVTDRITQDLTQFSAAAGLLSVVYESDDLNAVVGAQQGIAFTTTDALTATLTITQVDLSFARPNRAPWRRCQASTVRLAQLADIAEIQGA